MRQRIENQLIVTVDGTDLTQVSSPVFWIRQNYLLLEYVPEVIDSRTMRVTIPVSDTVRLHTGPAEVQFAFTDADGVPDASDVVRLSVDGLLKETGYGTV